MLVVLAVAEETQLAVLAMPEGLRRQKEIMGLLTLHLRNMAAVVVALLRRAVLEVLRGAVTELPLLCLVFLRFTLAVVAVARMMDQLRGRLLLRVAQVVAVLDQDTTLQALKMVLQIRAVGLADRLMETRHHAQAAQVSSSSRLDNKVRHE